MSPPTLLTYVPGTTESMEVDLNLRTRDQLLFELQENLKATQLHMKHRHDLRRRDEELEVGQQVYLKLQQYQVCEI